jgi:hypothetical protein
MVYQSRFSSMLFFVSLSLSLQAVVRYTLHTSSLSMLYTLTSITLRFVPKDYSSPSGPKNSSYILYSIHTLQFLPFSQKIYTPNSGQKPTSHFERSFHPSTIHSKTAKYRTRTPTCLTLPTIRSQQRPTSKGAVDIQLSYPDCHIRVP